MNDNYFETVFRGKKQSKKLNISNRKVSDHEYNFEVTPLGIVDDSTDRLVRLSSTYDNDPKLESIFIINAEDAIDLGMKLINAGKAALLDNMYNHNAYRIDMMVKDLIDKKIVEKMVLTLINDKCPNRAKSFREFEIKIIVKESDLYPFPMKEFTYTKFIYFNPYDKNKYENQLRKLVYFDPNIEVEVNNFDYDKYVEECVLLQIVDNPENVRFIPVGDTKEKLPCPISNGEFGYTKDELLKMAEQLKNNKK